MQRARKKKENYLCTLERESTNVRRHDMYEDEVLWELSELMSAGHFFRGGGRGS